MSVIFTRESRGAAEVSNTMTDLIWDYSMECYGLLWK